MADVTKNVIVDFQTTGLENLDNAGAKLKTINDLYKDQVVTFNDVNAATVKNTTLTDANTTATQENVNATTEQQAVYDKLSKTLISLSGTSKEAMQSILKFTPEQITKQFADLGITVDEYIDLLKQTQAGQDNTAKSANTLRTQLLAVKNQMAALVQIQETQGSLTAEQTKQFNALALQSGKLSNAIQQTNKVTRNLASDTPLIAAAAEGVTGLAGAFQAASGAAALFGSDNKDLQETLVKVTSVTAIAQGLQQSLSLVRKEGAIVTAAVIIQEKIETAQKIIQNGVESDSIVIRYAAIAAQKALNLAMKANPILLVIGALITYAIAMYEYIKATTEATKETAEFNSVIKDVTTGVEAYIKGIQDATDKQNAFAKDAGAAQSEILTNTGRSLVRQLQKNQEAQLTAAKEMNKLNAEIAEKGGEERVKRSNELQTILTKLEEEGGKLSTEILKTKLERDRALIEEDLNKQIDLAQARVARANPAGSGQFSAQRDLINKQAALQLEQARGNLDKQADINAETQRKITDNIQAEQQFRLDNAVAIAQQEATYQEQISKNAGDIINKAELDAANELDRAQLKRTLKNNKLTDDERLAQIDLTNAKIDDRNRAFEIKTRNREIEDDQNTQNLILDDITKNETQKLSARIFFIQDAAEKEIVAAKGNNEKIKAIEFKRDQDILSAKKAAILEAANFDRTTYETTIADEDRILEKSLADQASIRDAANPNRVANQLGVARQTLQQQFDSIDKIRNHQVEANQKTIDGLNNVFDLTGSLTDSEVEQYIAAQDAQVKAKEDAEARKVQITSDSADKQQELNRKILATSVQGVADGLNILASYYQAQDQADQDRIAHQKQAIQDELNAGIITQKAAIARNAELDAQQKKLQRESAIRSKKIAFFQAAIGTAQAIIAAAQTVPFIPLGLIAVGIATALGAAQLSIINSTPIPQFDKGKRKGEFQGIGQVAERHPEIVEKNGQMFLVKEPTAMWLGSEDVVFKPSETVKIMESMTFGKSPVIDSPGVRGSINQFNMDYERMGKVISENIPQYGLDLTEDGLQEWVQKGNTLTKYLNKRRSYRR